MLSFKNKTDVRKMSNNNSIRLACHVLREAGCKKAQKQDPPAGGSNPPVFEKHCFNIFVLFDLSEVVFCFIFYPAILAGLLLFDPPAGGSGKIHNKYLHAFFVFIG